MTKPGRKPSPRLQEAVQRVMAGETAYAVAQDMSRTGERIWLESLYRAVKRERKQSVGG